QAIVHACRIADACLIGMGSILLDGVVVEKHGFVGAGALVPPGKVVGSGEMWLGNPARKARMLSDQEIEALYYSAQHYVRLKDEYLNAQAERAAPRAPAPARAGTPPVRRAGSARGSPGGPPRGSPRSVSARGRPGRPATGSGTSA